MAWAAAVPPLSVGEALRLTLPRRMLSVRARADMSGYMVSRILMELSWEGLEEEPEGELTAEDGRRPGTGTACFGVRGGRGGPISERT